MIIAGKDERQVEDFKLVMAERFDVKDLGGWHFYLGMKIIQDNSTGDVWILNNHKVLEKFGAKSVATPTDPNTKLMKDKDKIYQAGV